MDRTGLAPIPDKLKGHLSLALNALRPIIPAISSQRCSTFHLLCATMAAPFAYKRRPMAHREGIRLFRTLQHLELVRELKNANRSTKAGS